MAIKIPAGQNQYSNVNSVKINNANVNILNLDSVQVWGREVTLTFSATNCSWSSESRTAYYGDTLVFDSSTNTVSCYAYAGMDSVSEEPICRWETAATINADDYDYHYQTLSIPLFANTNTIKITPTTLPNLTVSASATSYPKVYISSGNGVKDAYWSTAINCLPTDSTRKNSGTWATSSETIYGFIVLNGHYTPKSGWVLINGTDGEEDAVYRVDSEPYSGHSIDFGMINADIDLFTVAVHFSSSEISQFYYKANGSSEFIEAFDGDTLTNIEDLSTFYYYVEPAEHYHTNQSDINPAMFTIQCENVELYLGAENGDVEIDTFAITWKYLNACPENNTYEAPSSYWTTETETYNYGDTPSHANAADVYSGDGKAYRRTFNCWDNLTAVTRNRTITAYYDIDNYVYLGTCSHCGAKSADHYVYPGIGSDAGVWAKVIGIATVSGAILPQDLSPKILFEADSYYAFGVFSNPTSYGLGENGYGVGTKEVTITAPGSYTAAATLVLLNITDGTRSTVTVTDTNSAWSHAGNYWHTIDGVTATWQADPLYAFNSSGKDSDTTDLIPGATISVSANYGILSVTYIRCEASGSANGYYSLTDSNVKITVAAVTGPVNNNNKTRFYFDKTKAQSLATGQDSKTIISSQTASSVLPYINTVTPQYCTFDLTPDSTDHTYPDIRHTIEHGDLDEAWFVGDGSSPVLVTNYPLSSSPVRVAYSCDTGYAWQVGSSYSTYESFNFTNELAATHVTFPATHVGATFTLIHCTATVGGVQVVSGSPTWYPRTSQEGQITLAVTADSGWSILGDHVRDTVNFTHLYSSLPIASEYEAEYCQVTLASPGSYITTKASGVEVDDGTYIVEIGTGYQWYPDNGYRFEIIGQGIYVPEEEVTEPGTYSHRPEQAIITINRQHCGVTSVTVPQGITAFYDIDKSYDYVGNYTITVILPEGNAVTVPGFSVGLTSATNYYYGANESDKTATITQITAPGTYSNNPEYIKVWFTGSHCEPQVRSNDTYTTIPSPSILKSPMSVYSYTSEAGYAYDSSGTMKRSGNIIVANAPITFNLYEPTYCYITIIPIYCSVVVKDKNQNVISLTNENNQLKGWIPSTKYPITLYATAIDGFTFTQDKAANESTDTREFGPDTYYIQPLYGAFSFSGLANCSVDIKYIDPYKAHNNQEWHPGTTFQPTVYNYAYCYIDNGVVSPNILRFDANEDYSYSEDGQDPYNLPVLQPGNYPCNPTYGYLGLELTNCTTTTTEGWYKLTDYPNGISVEITAGENRAFTATDFSTTYNNKTTKTANLPHTFAAEPEYVQVEINCTNCTALIDEHDVTNTSYWYKTGKTIYLSATDDITTGKKYAFTSAGSPDTEWTFSVDNPLVGRNALSFAPEYGYYKYLLSHCTYKSGKLNGYVGDVGEICSTTLTPDQYYSYAAGSTQTNGSIMGTIPCTISAAATEPGYIRAKSIQLNNSCTPYVGSNLASATTYYAKGTKWNWKASTGYAFDSSGTNAQETTLVVGSDMSNIAPYIKAASITGVNVKSIDKDASTWYAASSNPQITWTAEDGYHFGDNNNTITTYEALTPNGTHTKTAVRNSYWVTFSVPSGSNFYGYWKDENNVNRGTTHTRTAYYGDKIVKSNTKVTCYKYDDTTAERWSMTAISNSDAEYDYTTPTVSGNSINSVTANATFQASNTRSKHEYKVTWKYMNSYDSWTTVDTWYYLNDSLTSAPRRGTKPTPAEVVNSTSTYRFVPLEWDNTGTVTQNITVEEEYRKDFYAKVTSTRGYFVSIDGVTTRQIYEYEDWFEVMNASGVGHTFEFHADQYCAFDSAGQVETLTKTINAPGTYNYSFDYIQVEVTKTTNCNTASKSTGWHAYNTQCTWTAETGYASNSAGNTSYVKNFTTPGATYTDDGFNYVYLTINRNNCVAASGSAAQGWYKLGASTKALSVKSTANSGWSFLGVTAKDTDTYTVGYPTAPKTVTHAPTWFYLTFNGTNCHAVRSGTSTTLTSRFYQSAETFYWKTDDDNSYAFTSSGDHTTANITTTAYPNTYTKTADYGKYTVTTGSRCTANVTTGWYPVAASKTTRFTAKSGWSFGGTSVGDYTDKSAAVPGSVSASPTYCKVTVTGSHYSSFTVGSTSYTSTYTGIVKENTQIKWNAASGYALNYAGDTYDTETIVGPDTYECNFNYGFVIITNVKNCTATGIDPFSGGYMEVFGLNSSPVVITFTANQGYSFNGDQTEDTITRSITVPGALSGIEPTFAEVVLPQIAHVAAFWHNDSQMFSGTYVLEIGSTVISEAATSYAYGEGASEYEETITSPGEYGVAPDYGRYTVTFTNCAKSSGYSTGWYPLTTNLSTTATASTGWSFGGSTAGDTQSTGTVHAPYSKAFSPTNVQVVLGGSDCTIRQGSTTGTVKAAGTYIVPVGTKFYWMPGNRLSYAAGSAGNVTTYKIVTMNEPGTHNYTPGYAIVTTINSTRCYADHNTSTFYPIGEIITFTADDYCAFDVVNGQPITEDTSQTISATGTPSASADYVLVNEYDGINCTAQTSMGWKLYGTPITWNADTGYAFDNNNKTSITTGAVPGLNTAEANCLRFYTITFSGPTYGSWGSTSKTAYHFDKLVKSGTTVTCYDGDSDNQRWTNTVTKATDTSQWAYTTPAIGTVPTSVTGAHTISATDGRTENKYNVTFTNGSYGTWDSTTTISATYSTQITISGNTVTVGSTSRTYTRNTNTTQYTYGNTVKVDGTTTTPQTVGTGKAVTSTDTRTVNKYAVSITAGAGISSVFLSLSAPDTSAHTPASGDASGTQYFYGVPVYAYAVLAEHYDIPAGSGWTLVKGTANAAGAIYHVATLDSVSGAHNFGTIDAAIEKYTLNITKGNGISTIYYKVNGASSYTSSTSNVSVSVNDQSIYYYYAVADSYHTANSDCGTSSSPKSGTVNCADISVSVSTTAKTYALAGEWDNGTVKFYNSSTHTTQITQATYGSTVYYTLTGNTGYQNGTSGSITLNSTNFTFASGVATHDFGAASRISAPLSQGTLPTGIASITCYRKPYDGSSYSVFTGNTIYYGDSFYWTATASTGYNNPTLTYYDASHTITWTGSQGNGITSVGTSGVASGGLKAYTISFGTTSGKTLYGSWGSTSKTAYHFDKITVSGTTVTCYQGSSSTVRWTNTVTASTMTDQYSYTTPKITGSDITSLTGNASYTADNARAIRQYTITWKYRSNYSTETTASTVYFYGDTPGTTTPQSGTVPTPDTYVTSGNTRREKKGWDSLATVTGPRTITMTYADQVKITTISAHNCKVYINSDYLDEVTTNTWYYIENIKDTDTLENGLIYVKAEPNCAMYFGQGGEPQTQWTKSKTSGGAIDETANKIKITSASGSHCTSDAQLNVWVEEDTQITWTADEGYCFDQSNNLTEVTTDAIPGVNPAPTTYVQKFTLTFSVTSGSYGTYYITRTPTYTGAPTAETWSNVSSGTTKAIYYGDKLTTSHSANSDSATSWGDWPTIAAPTAITTGNATSGNLTVKNEDSSSVTLYYNTTNSTSGGTSLGLTNAGATRYKDGLSFSTTYYLYAARTITRTGSHYHYTDNSTYSGTTSVSGNVSASFSFSRSSVADSESKSATSSVSSYATAAQTYYTITFTRQRKDATGPQSLGSATSDTSIGVASVSVPYGGSYSQTFSKTNYISQTKSGSNITADATVTVTLEPNSYTVGQTAISNASESVNYSWVYHGQSASQTVTPDIGYDYTANSVRYYNGNSYSRSATITSNYTFGALTMNQFDYIVSGGSSANGSVAWSNSKKIGGSATWTITANTGYSRPSTYTGNVTINATNFTLNEANKTAVYKGSAFDPCTINSYAVTISATHCKATYLSTSQTATSGSASGTAFNYGLIVYGFATLNDNTNQYTYIAPPSGWVHISGRTYRVGSVTVNTSGNSISTAASRTLTAHTISFNTPTYGSWDNATGATAYYGDYISISGNTVTCKAGSSSGNARWTRTLSANTADDTYTYWASITTSSFTVEDAATIATTSGREYIPYTITWKYLSAYDTWTTATETYHYNDTPSRSTPSAVASGSYRKRVNTNYTNGWDSLAKVTGSRTITCQYVNQVYITFSGTRCSCTSHSNGWYDTSSTAFSTTWEPINNCSFNSNGTSDAHSENVTPNTPKTVQVTASYIYVTVGSSYCKSVTKSTGWHEYNTECIWYALDGGYSFSSSSSVTAVSANFTIPGRLYTNSAKYAYVTIDYRHCIMNSGSTSSGYFDLSASTADFPIKATAEDGWSFGGTTNQDTTSYSVSWPTAPRTVWVYPSYFFVIVNTGDYCSADRSSGWWTSDKKITWTPSNTYYSFDAGTTQTTKEITTNGPGVYPASAATPTNIRVNSIVTGTYNQSVSINNSTYYASSTKPVWTAAPNYYYGSSSSNTTYTGSAISAGANISAPNPTHIKCTISTVHCTSSPTDGSIVAVGTNTITYTALDGYSFAAGTSQTKNAYSSVVLGTTSYGNNAKYKYITVGNNSENCSANVSTGYRELGTSITWTGSSDTVSGASVKYSFSNTPISNPSNTQRQTSETIVDSKSVYNQSAQYRYVSISVDKETGFTTNYSNGDWVLDGTTFRYTAPSATSTRRISFSSTDYSANTKDVADVSPSHSSFITPLHYVWMNCTCTGTHCSATNGWYRVGTSITWTGESGTNYKYGFTSNTTWNDSYATTTTTVVDGTSSYSKTASYLYYNVTITKNTGTASATHSSGYLLNGTTGSFTATTNTNTVRYSYSNSASNTHTQSYTVSSAGQSISSGTVYTWYYITVQANTNSSVTANGSGWYLSSSTAKTSTWTVSDSAAYTFNSDHTANSQTTKNWTPNQAQTVTAPTVYTRYYTVTFATANNISGLSVGYWTSSSLWVPYGTTWSTSGATVTLSGSQGSSAYTKGTANGYTSAYTISPETGTVDGNKTIRGTTNYTRITWSLNLTKGAYVSKYYYSFGSGTQVEIQGETGQINDIDYDTSVTITATSEGAAPYNYALQGAGTFTYNGESSQSTTVYYNRTVKSYTLTISATGTDYASSYGVTRNSSPYQGATTGALSNGATIYYGDTLSASYTAANTRYGDWDVSSLTAPGVTSSGDVTKPTIYITNNNSVTCGVHINTNNQVPQAVSYTLPDGRTGTLNNEDDEDIQYGSTVYVWFSYQHWRNYWTRSGSVNQSSATVYGNTTFSFTFTENAAQQGSEYIYSSYTSKTVSNRNAYTITFNNPTYGSWGSATKTAYYGSSLTNSGNTVSGTNSSGSWSNTLSANSSTNDYYTYSASVSGSFPITVNGTKTISTASSRTPKNYKINGTYTNGTVTFYSNSAHTTQITTADYGATVYYTLTGNNGYYDGTSGSIAFTSDNFLFKSYDAGSSATKGFGSATRKSFTITLAKASSNNYFDWKNGSTTVTSMTAYYGDIISTSSNTVTCKKWDATTTVRWTVTATAYSNTDQYSYSTPTVTGGTISSVTAAATITGSNNRTTNQYAVDNIGPSGTHGNVSTISTWYPAQASGYYTGPHNFPYGTVVYGWILSVEPGLAPTGGDAHGGWTLMSTDNSGYTFWRSAQSKTVSATTSNNIFNWDALVTNSYTIHWYSPFAIDENVWGSGITFTYKGYSSGIYHYKMTGVARNMDIIFETASIYVGGTWASLYTSGGQVAAAVYKSGSTTDPISTYDGYITAGSASYTADTLGNGSSPIAIRLIAATPEQSSSS